VKTSFRALRIRGKLMWIAVLASGAALLVAGVALAVQQNRQFRRSLVRELHTHARIVGLNSSSAILFHDEAAATATLAALKLDPRVLGAAVYDDAGRLFAAYTPEPGRFEPPPTVSRSEPLERFDGDALVVVDTIVVDDRPIGVVLLRGSFLELREQLRSFAWILVLVSAISLGVAVLLSRRYQEAISRPVQGLVDSARRVAEEKDYSVRAAREGDDELGLLVDSFNGMLDQIQQRDAQLALAMRELETRVEERTADLKRELAERRLAEQEILRLNGENEVRLAELTALNAEIESFSYSVSHDLRAPLRHINGFVQLLKTHAAGALDEKGLRYLGVIADGARRMGRLIDDLLSFSRTTRAEMAVTEVDLAPLVREEIASIMAGADGRQVEWTVGELPRVKGDPGLLRIVWTNLLSNAFKYTGKAQRAHIAVGTMPGQDGQAVVFVRDDGVGFDMRYVDKLFGVFQRLHKADEFEGTGIGLATVRRIVTRHKGNVWAESAPGAGTTFFVSLPVAGQS
jgi:signal transduction histidine kinase